MKSVNSANTPNPSATSKIRRLEIRNKSKSFGQKASQIIPKTGEFYELIPYRTIASAM